MHLKRLFIYMALIIGFSGPAAADDVVRVAEGPFVSAGAFFIARDKGYFKKLGIEIETRKFEDGSLAIPAMIAGEIDISTMPASAGLFNAVAKGAPITIVLDRGNDSKDHAYTTISITNEMAAKGITSVADFAKLKGARIGINSVGSINQYLMARALEKAGLDPVKDVSWTANIAQPDLMKMLGQKNIDVAAISYQFSLFAQNAKWGPIVATGYDIEPGVQVATYAARKDFIANKRDVLVRFAMAYLQGIKEFNAAATDPGAHPADIKILAENTVLNKPEMVTAIAPHWTYVNEDGLPNVDSIMVMQDFWAAGRFNLIQKKVSREQLFDLTIAKEAAARLAKENPFKP
jgi:NitT/TauT family transport system substrate-binding protein